MTLHDCKQRGEVLSANGSSFSSNAKNISMELTVI